MLTLREREAVIDSIVTSQQLAGVPVTSATAAAALDRALRRPLVEIGSPVRLTPREIEVVVGLANGLTQKEIAVRLHIAAQTTKAHVARVYQKLGALNGPHAMALALKFGIITLEDVAVSAAERGE